MKKALAILMTLLMLCSMVVFVSAADKTFEGKGFTIDVPDGYTFEAGEEADGEIGYFISANDENVNSEIEIFVSKSDDAKAEFEEIANGEEIVTFAGRPAIIGYGEDDNCSITTYTDGYLYGIDCEGDSEGAKAAYKIAETIKFTDAQENGNSNQDKTCEGKGFTIDVPDGYSFDGTEVNEGDEEAYSYFISADDDNVNSEVEISVVKYNDTKAQFEEIIGEDEITTFAGRPATIGEWEGEAYFIITYTDNYVISIDCEGDAEGYKAAYEIAKTIKFTDVAADDTDTDTTGAVEEAPNKTVLIAVIAVAAVLIVAGVVVIVVFTKKKKNN